MNYSEILKYLETYYSNLLIVQYNGKPKARATIKMLVNLIYSNMLINQIRDGFDWRNAKGRQLDIIGFWIGLDRFFKGQLFDFHSWYSLIDWDSEPENTQGGFSTFETFNTEEGGFLDYENIRPTQNRLDDSEFRILIGLKIIKNSIDHKAKTIDDAIWNYEFFNNMVYTTWDLETRELVYHYPEEFRIIMQAAKDKQVLPCPPPMTIKLQEVIQ